MRHLIDHWRDHVAKAARRWPTPFYLCAWRPIEEALRELQLIEAGRVVRHLLSVKSHPVRPLLEQWARSGRGAEVVSEHELRAALAAGFLPPAIVVNGVAKHHWLGQFPIEGLTVHIDSLAEVPLVSTWARRFAWQLGLRLHVKAEFDPDDPTFGGQFGLSAEEFREAFHALTRNGVMPAGVHFHLRSNVMRVQDYADALHETLELCRAIGWEPSYVDTGGGLPDPGVSPSPGVSYLQRLGVDLRGVASSMPSIREIWMEHGRFVTGRSSVLVGKVLDIKNRPECRYLICDAGRTNHAIVSDWETHSLSVAPDRTGPPVLTTVCGPTCMAFDRLARLPLAEDIAVGDLIIWGCAGAYHIPWETRFSNGLASVIWCADDSLMRLCREKESFSTWWSTWDA